MKQYEQTSVAFIGGAATITETSHNGPKEKMPELIILKAEHRKWIEGNIVHVTPPQSIKLDQYQVRALHEFLVKYYES